MSDNVLRVPPQKFIHVLDNNTNVSRLIEGPVIFIRKDQEQVVKGPESMIQLAPRTYCKVKDPVVRGEDGNVELTEFGQVKNRFGDFQIRRAEEYNKPFSLYPGESLEGNVEQQITVLKNQALRLEATRDFNDELDKIQRFAGEIYQRLGPTTYVPRVEEKVVSIDNALTINANQALKMNVIQDFVDKNKVQRRIGESYLVRTVGSYLPSVYEKLEEKRNGYVLTDKQALHLRAQKDFVDVYGHQRLAGQEWLITNQDSPVHILDVQEELVKNVSAITLSKREYCIILDPRDKKTQLNNWGSKLLVQGEATFFLQPGERLQDFKVYQIRILGEDQALLLKANQDFVDHENVSRTAGQTWLIQGPREYVPPVQVTIVEERQAIPLDENEGIYIRDKQTGEVYAHKGSTYLLKAHQELWEKELDQETEYLLALGQTGIHYISPMVNSKGEYTYERPQVNLNRIKNRIVTYKAPHNSAVQLFDFKTKQSRVVFGPDLVLLGPDENFTMVSISGGKPKKENAIKCLQLALGPDFMTDVVIVETSDHARLSLELSYNWMFKFDKTDQDQCRKLFSVKDFVGDACKSIASRVRGAVSAVSFEEFHHHSSTKIKEAVFGKDKNGNIREEMLFPTNNLCITQVDIKNMEVTDLKTRENLSRSINLAIEINSQSQEAAAKHQAERLEQQAKGQLERQALDDQSKAEEAKIKLLKLQAESIAVKVRGEAIALAKAKAETDRIHGEAAKKQAELKAEALKIEYEAELEQLRSQQKADLIDLQERVELEIKKSKELSQIEINKFSQIVKAIGQDTLVEIAKAGPEMKAKLLKGLGLKGFMVTDGKNPINLFNTANGLMGETK